MPKTEDTFLVGDAEDLVLIVHPTGSIDISMVFSWAAVKLVPSSHSPGTPMLGSEGKTITVLVLTCTAVSGAD